MSQVQSGVTLQHSGADGREATVTVYGVSRDLKNPQTFAYIDVNRVDYGVRTAVTVPLALASMRQRLTAGLDFQRQRDDRKNFAYRPGTPLPDTSRLLDQLEHVTELGPFVQSVVELTPGTTVTGGLRYEVSVEDPDTWAGPWTAALNLRPQPAGMFEYACHEGNYAMKNMLSASRAADARAAGGPRD